MLSLQYSHVWLKQILVSLESSFGCCGKHWTRTIESISVCCNGSICHKWSNQFPVVINANSWIGWLINFFCVRNKIVVYSNFPYKQHCMKLLSVIFLHQCMQLVWAKERFGQHAFSYGSQNWVQDTHPEIVAHLVCCRILKYFARLQYKLSVSNVEIAPIEMNSHTSVLRYIRAHTGWMNSHHSPLHSSSLSLLFSLPARGGRWWWRRERRPLPPCACSCSSCCQGHPISSSPITPATATESAT